MRYQKKFIQQILFAVGLPFCLTSCASWTKTEPVTQLPANVKSEAAVLDSLSQDDKDRLAMYRECLTVLKTVTNPAIDESYNIVTNSDVQAARNRAAGSPTAYDNATSEVEANDSSSNQTSPTYSARNYASEDNSRHTRLQQIYSDKAILEAHQAKEALDRGDMRAARELTRSSQENAMLFRAEGGVP